MARAVFLGVVIATAMSVAACGGSSGGSSQPPSITPADLGLPWPATPMPAAQAPVDNPITDEKTELGKYLFHDPIFSSDRQVACVTCHSQYWGMSDGLQFSIGVGGKGPAGTGRTGPNPTLRNSPTLWNAAYRPLLFWDGRASSLEEQAAGPMNNPIELGRAPEDVVADLRNIPEYVTLYQNAFGSGDVVTVDNTLKAIATFVRTLISDNAPYDRYLRGDLGAMSDDEKRGMTLFAEAGCGGCHTPPLFESANYYAVNVPEVEGRERDLGRYNVTGNEIDKYAMRVPTLRNLRETGPYFHNGTATTIDFAVTVMVQQFGARAVTDDERSAIVTFLTKSLIDRTHDPDRPTRVPSGLPVPVDDFQIPR